MNTVTPSANSTRAARNGATNADEIRRLVGVAKERGLMRLPGEAAPVAKNGFDLANLGDVRSQWMDISPEMAAAWLKNNFRNRPVREDTVKAYARDMLAGAWTPTHQGIAFNDADALIDGQHRLRAIVMSGVTVRMMVTFGLPSKIEGQQMTTMDAVDRGATRSVGDQLVIQHGLKNGSLTASISAALASLCFGERTRRLSVGQTLEVYRAFEPAIAYVIEHRSKQVGLRTAGVMAGFAFALMTEDKFWESNTPVAEMFAQVTTVITARYGEKIAPGAIQLLRNFLTSEESKLFTRSLDRGLSELVLQAIWLQMKNTAVEKLEPGFDGLNFFRALQPERVAKIAALFTLPVTDASGGAGGSTRGACAPHPGPQAERPSVQDILKQVERVCGIDSLLLLGKSVHPDIAVPRNIAISLALKAGHTKETIAAVLNRTPEQIASANLPEPLSMAMARQIERIKKWLGI